jgi:catechol 2,3-dioxygenase-like lactoylglutathione lyase family enzyme
MRRLALAFTILACCVAAFASDPPKRPRIFGIDRVRIYVSDVAKTSKLYAEIFGLPKGGSGCRGVSLACFTADWGPKQAVELEASPSPQPRNLVAEVAFATDNVSQMRRYLVSHDVAVSTISEDAEGNRHFDLHDPEGNLIAFVEPSLSIDDPPFYHAVGKHVIHAGFVVHDCAAEDRFYKDILDFHLYWHGGMKDDKDDWVAMQVPDGTDWVEYMLNISPSADKRTLGVMNHIALGVPDIQAAKAQLIKNGWKPGEEPKLGRDGKWQLNLYDPDDTRVEFMEFTPKEKPCCSEFTGPHPGPKQ